MTVIVLDTNAMPHAQFSRSALDTLQRVAGRGASIVIPEVVIWEWAEHALSAHVALEEAIKRHRVDPGIAGRPGINPAPTVDEFVARIESALPAGVTVWRPESGVWRQALRGQVLQVGSGETKGEVKTGAADAVVLACIQWQSDQAEGAVVVMTSDKRLRKHAKPLNNVRFATGTGGLLMELRTFVPPADDIAVRLMERLPEYFNERMGDYGETLPLRDALVAINTNPVPSGWADGGGLSSLVITRVDIAEIYDIQVETDGEDRVALAQLRLFGTILGEVVVHRDGDDDEPRATREVIDFSSAFVDVTVAVTFDHYWAVLEVLPTGSAVLVISDSEAESDDEDTDDAIHFYADPD